MPGCPPRNATTSSRLSAHHILEPDNRRPAGADRNQATPCAGRGVCSGHLATRLMVTSPRDPVTGPDAAGYGCPPYAPGKTSMSNSSPSGSPCHRHRKPPSSRMFPGSSQRRRASLLRVDWSRSSATRSRCTRFLPGLASATGWNPTVGPSSVATGRELPVADLRVHGYGGHATPEPGQGRRIGGIDHEITHLRSHIGLPPARD